MKKDKLSESALNGKTTLKNFVVYSAGFKETGALGQKLEQKITQFATENDLNILGPNCLGYLNRNSKINCTFAKVNDTEGPLKFLSQSGALASSIFDWAQFNEIGFSEFITLGNKAILNENDILYHWLQSGLERGVPIGMYLESITDGQAFVEIASLIAIRNPMFILKPGKSKGAKKAMQSHTGSIAGEDYVLDVAFKKAGIMRCATIEELFDSAKAFSWAPLPAGPRVAVVSNAGGPAVICADLIDETDLELAELASETDKYLKDHLPRAANIHNPVDVLGDALADRYQFALEATLKDENVDSVLVLLTPQLMTQIEKTAKAIYELVSSHNKPVVCSFIGGNEVEKGSKILNEHKIPAFQFPNRAVSVLAKLWGYSSYLQENHPTNASVTSLIIDPVDEYKEKKLDTIGAIIANAQDQKRNTLSLLEVDNIFKNYDIPTPQSAEITSSIEGVGFAENSGWPVVLKISSAEVLHKKDVGGVITNISTERQLTKAYKDLYMLASDYKDARIQIQAQVQEGVELILGVKKDPKFGNVLMFGAGGSLAELINDRNLALLPLDRSEITDMVMGSKVYKLLSGFRGDKAYDLKPLYNLINLLADLASNIEEFEELEINPVILNHQGVFAVDGKAVIQS